MYAKLNYNASAGNNNEQVLEDIKDLLLGETVVGNIVGDIDTGTSLIDTSYTTVAWTLYDTVGTNAFIFQIPYHDDAGQFMYLELFAFATDEIHMKLWESWDTGSNTGSNGAYYTSNGFELMFNTSFTTTPFNIFVSATDRHLVVRSEYASGQRKYFRGFMQYDRGEAWDTPAAGKAPGFLTFNDTFTSSQVYPLPHKRSDGSVYTLSPAGLYMAVRYGNSQLDDLNLLIGGNSSAARGLNATGDPVHNMYEFGFSYLSSGERFLTGKIPDMYLATYQNGGFGDVVSIGGNDYIIWEADLNYRIAVRKG
jgi:hypothetical protein